MSLVNQAIPNLINGISQQPPEIRLPSQAQVQENFDATPTDGLKKRPGTRMVAEIGNFTADATYYVHPIKRDESEEYILVIEDGDLRVFDVQTGAEQTVTFPNGKSYLNAAVPDQTMKAVTVADFTFILNTEQVVGTQSNIIPTRVPDGLIWVRQADFQARYAVKVNGTIVGQYQTDGNNERRDVGTENIKESLLNAPAYTKTQPDLTFFQIKTELGTTDWSFSDQDAIIYIRNDLDQDFDLETIDDNSGNSLIAIKDTVQNFTDLPKNAFKNFRIKVEGDFQRNEDDYYVRFDTSSSTNNWEGVWVETIKTGEKFKLAPATMPHVLVRQADGTFEFRQATWENRKVGSLETNPFPSFVGQTINELFFHRNRLGFLSGENIIFSASGRFFEFFRETVTQVLDTDPIDVAVTGTKVSKLLHAVPFDSTVLFFSKESQFQLGQVETLTPETIRVNETTTFESDRVIPPVKVGRFAYFVNRQTTGSQVYEYFVDSVTETEDATQITSPVPSFIPPQIRFMTASPNENVLVLGLKNKRLYIYRYFWQQNNKLQSSWYRFTLPHAQDILGGVFIRDKLHLLVRSSDTLQPVSLETLDFSLKQTTGEFDFPIALDSMIDETQASTVDVDSNAGTTTISTFGTQVVPADIQDDYVLVAGTGPNGPGFVPGEVVPHTRINNRSIQVNGALNSFYLGYKYRSVYEFSPFYVRDPNSGDVPVTLGSGRLQLRMLYLSYGPSIEYQVKVEARSRDPYIYNFYAYELGVDDLSVVSPKEGRYRVRIGSNNLDTTIKLLNHSHLPCQFTSAEWEGDFTIKSKRLS